MIPKIFCEKLYGMPMEKCNFLEQRMSEMNISGVKHGGGSVMFWNSSVVSARVTIRL